MCIKKHAKTFFSLTPSAIFSTNPCVCRAFPFGLHHRLQKGLIFSLGPWSAGVEACMFLSMTSPTEGEDLKQIICRRAGRNMLFHRTALVASHTWPAMPECHPWLRRRRGPFALNLWIRADTHQPAGRVDGEPGRIFQYFLSHAEAVLVNTTTAASFSVFDQNQVSQPCEGSLYICFEKAFPQVLQGLQSHWPHSYLQNHCVK